MGEFTDNIATFFVIGGAIALIACGVSIAKPNLHGVKFKEGTCQIFSAVQRPFWRDLPTCSCGKNCNEEYPCLTINAQFNGANGSESFKGTIHYNYFSLKEECLYIPSECDNDFDENALSVYKYFVGHIVPLVNHDMRYPYLQGYNRTEVHYKNTPTFDCWGYDGAIYVDHKYSMVKVYMSLGIPIAFILLGIAVSGVCGSSEHRDCLFHVIFWPFVFLGAVVAEIAECFDCRCHRPSCNCLKRRPAAAPRREIDLEIDVRSSRRTMSLESLDLEMRRPHRRDSYELGRAAVLTPRTRRSSFGSLGELRLHLSRPEEPVLSIEVNPELSVYPSSVAPPSYNNVRHDIDGYQPSFSNPPILTGPVDVSPYSSDLPPPPSYDDVVN